MKILSLFILLIVTYTGGVFLAPDFFDTYGFSELNTKIRTFKASLEVDSLNFGSGKALIDNINDIAVPYIEEAKKSTLEIKETITTKTEQVKDAADSVGNAINALEGAKNDIQDLTRFGTGTN